jgi:hypothetical protein
MEATASIKASHFQFKTEIMSLRTSTKQDEEVVPDVFDILAMSTTDFHGDSMSSFSRDELYFDAKEKKTEKKKERLPAIEGSLEQLFFPSHFQFKAQIMSLRTSTKQDKKVVPDVFDIPAMSTADFRDEAMSSFSRDELSFDAKEKKTEKKKEKLPANEGALEQLFFPSAARVSKSAKEKVQSYTKSSKASKDLPLPEHVKRRQSSKKSKRLSKQSRSSPSLAAMGLYSSNENKKRTKSPKSSRDSQTNINAAWNLPDLPLTEHVKRRQSSKKSKGLSKQSRSSPSLAALGLSSSNENKKRTKSLKSSRDSPTNINAAWNLPDMNPSSTSKYGDARKSSKTDKDLYNNTWNLIVASLSPSIEHGRRTVSSITNIDMPDLCLSPSSEHGGRRKATEGSNDLIKMLGLADLDPCSSPEQETRRKSSTANRDSVKKISSAPRLSDMSLSSSSEQGKGRKPSKSNKGLANHTWSLADMSLSSSKGLDKLDRRSSSGLSSSSENRRKLSSKGLNKLDRSSLLGISSSSVHRKTKKSPKARKDLSKKSTSSPSLARMSLLSPLEDRKRRTRKSPTKVPSHTTVVGSSQPEFLDSWIG